MTSKVYIYKCLECGKENKRRSKVAQRLVSMMICRFCDESGSMTFLMEKEE